MRQPKLANHMTRLSHSQYLKLNQRQKVHYLAEAKLASAKQVHRDLGNGTMRYYQASIRQVIVSPTLFLERNAAYKAATEKLAKIKAKSAELKSTQLS